MNTGTQKKTKRSGISPLAVLFVALIILFFIGCGAIFFFMEGTNIHQGISGFCQRMLYAYPPCHCRRCRADMLRKGNSFARKNRQIRTPVPAWLHPQYHHSLFHAEKYVFGFSLPESPSRHLPAKSVFRYGLRRGRSHQLSHGRGWNRWKGALF